MAGVLAAWLIYFRHYFHARSDRPSVQQGLRVLVMAFLFTLGIRRVRFLLARPALQRQFRFHWQRCARQSSCLPSSMIRDWCRSPVSVVILPARSTSSGWSPFVYAAWMLVATSFCARASYFRRTRSGCRDAPRAYGHSSLARMTLFDDKAYFFSPGGSFLAYQIHGRVAITLGDPIGPRRQTWRRRSRVSVNICSQNDWEPAFYQTLPETLAVYRAAGFESLCYWS